MIGSDPAVHRVRQGMGAKKVGLAVCVGLIREGREFARFLDRAGFQEFCSLHGWGIETSGDGDT